jgi:hypothetical protein
MNYFIIYENESKILEEIEKLKDIVIDDKPQLSLSILTTV